jgi:tetratricopeptide (TPR) repeat protein
MSLLIKALDKAEQSKNAEGQTDSSVGELSLEPVSIGGNASTPVAALDSDSNGLQIGQKTASTVFAAKQASAKPRASKNPTLIAAIGLFAMLLIGFLIYNYIQGLSKPALLPRPVAATLAPPTSATEQISSLEPPALPSQTIEAEQLTKTGVESVNAAVVLPPSPPDASNKAVKTAKPEPMVFGEPIEDSKQSSMQITRNNPGPRMNPDLMAAYRAFNAGDDAESQELYRKVLRSDVRNVDALLGMASIAQRQGRNQDAMGWYGKVLEIEPRNSIAQAAMANTISQADPVSTESRIKNLLAQQPTAPHLHEALGNIYAERGQWAAAQQSFFEAHRLEATNPEYAFNLAISLDQLGKPSLALEYYKKTLDLMQRTSTTTIDRSQLESRITQLQ